MGFGSRKFIVTVYFGSAVFLLCAFGKLSGSELVTAIIALAGVYSGANVMQKRGGEGQ